MEHTIEISIGNSPVLYHIRNTRAPKPYDGFGTIELANYGGPEGRLVMIRDEHYQWQTSRYASGIFACTPPATNLSGEVQQELWRRLLGKAT
jgi:hypothetical protein